MRKVAWHMNRIKYYGQKETLKYVQSLLEEMQDALKNKEGLLNVYEDIIRDDTKKSEHQAKRIGELDARLRAILVKNAHQQHIIAVKTQRIGELQGTIDSLKRQNKELQANLLAKDGIIKKQTIMLEEAKPKESEYVKAGNLFYCSNCKADFEHYELHNKYCPECGARFTNHRKDAL